MGHVVVVALLQDTTCFTDLVARVLEKQQRRLIKNSAVNNPAIIEEQARLLAEADM